MQSSSRSSYAFPDHRRKLFAAEVRKRRFLEGLAAWVIVLALALVVTFAAIWLSKWFDENQITSSVSSHYLPNRNARVALTIGSV